jgi:hypothetical protein
MKSIDLEPLTEDAQRKEGSFVVNCRNLKVASASDDCCRNWSGHHGRRCETMHAPRVTNFSVAARELLMCNVVNAEIGS